MRFPLTLKTFPGVLTLTLAGWLAVAGLHAADYYCDPVNGSMRNPGTMESPWGALETVFANGRTFASGDVIYLRDGFHGAPVVTGGPASGSVSIRPQDGNSPKLRRLGVDHAQHWIISGLNISQENAGDVDRVDQKGAVRGLVDILPSSHHITVENCAIRCSTSVSGWSRSDFGARMGTGVHVAGVHCTIRKNHIRNIRTGVWVQFEADNVVVSENVVEDILNDGIFALSNDGLYEYNTLRNWYGVNSNHDDGIQSWTSGGGNGIPTGERTLYRNVFRGNTIINNTTGPGRPFPDDEGHGVNGMGFFSGMFVDFVFENNVIIVDHVHALTVLGATGCRIVNNTVIQNPYHPKNNIPIITIRHHKSYPEHPSLASSGNIIENNFASDLPSGRDYWAAQGVVDYPNASNFESQSHNANFAYYPADNLNSGYDLHLKSTSGAVGIGRTAHAPVIDHDRVARSVPYDAGAFESGATPEAPLTSNPAAARGHIDRQP
ncbi:MAG: right-handed parallel beta-helix repeat-containing protein [Opitutaceae bacterium]|nr:right-handed parallel beta-helix repeat-containing protein [Opitutaceae bacterium]